MTITLTTNQLIAMADFAGLKVDTHGLDIDDETEYTLDDEHNLDCLDKSKPVFYCTEYPEEGAIQLK
ncbi:hypothetical protein PPO02_06480 [Proteus mirabilis]|uniref:hypothetical protein n=1 Tax=Proteus mirabilis TaxID=584 RepID=UPI002349E3A8|nr:hypothetical protein [Proteus mirabilis]MDC5894360.1 hypothetical protein [Proteus mirabilis]MDC5915494.1 hypothetical protein [Proteus mirabilis]MDC5926010.1 hypothetical protein [Proteus mirabilis]MDC6010995.1 hypothetical protein [Proteus mirabilis]MDC6021568.1 hypothetical protein [Proteus mirabilis]